MIDIHFKHDEIKFRQFLNLLKLEHHRFRMSTEKDQTSIYIEVTGEEKRLFPENFGQTLQGRWYKPRFLDKNLDDERIKCEQDVINCIDKYPLVKIMFNALEKAGCKVNLRQHFSCEVCGDGITGGYDARKNKIIICQNRNKREKQLYQTIAHEMLHMFDHCRAEFDYRNLEHIACTEIRAANLFHCALGESLVDSSVLFWNIYKGFPKCVRQKAIDTLTATGRVEQERASKIVDKVFDRCYADLEPVGRRFLHKIDQQERCYKERHIYGYGYKS